VEKEGGKHFNSSYLLSPQGEVLGELPEDPPFRLQLKGKPDSGHGDKVVVADTPLGQMGLVTCYDLRFPELFRRMVEKGAELFLVCSAWPYPRLEHWIMLNRVRALENQSFLVSANTVGMNAGTMLYGPQHDAVDPWGVIVSSGGDEEVILRAEVDLEMVKKTRERFPALADRQAWLGNAL
jgi:predicted amidohydrolase